MAFDTTLAEYLRERMGVYDTDTDTTAGSKFDREVLQPLLTRLGDSPLDVDLTTLVQETVELEDSDVLVRPGSALHDLMVRFLSGAFAPLKRELRFGKVGASFDNADSMRTSELSSRMGNFFLSLNAGRKTVVKIRIEYRTPRAVAVTPLSEFQLGALKYYPTSTQSVTSSAMSLNRTTAGRYYLDVTVEAGAAGVASDPTVGQLMSSTELNDSEKISVLSVTTRGVDPETTTEAVARTQDSITARNLETASGIRTVLKDASNFPELGNIVVVGAGDSEMDRDIVEGFALVSDIPGGILGFGPPDVGAGSKIHIGCKTDVYIQGTLNEYATDIDNIANIGKFLIESATGYTLSAADGGVDLLHDDSVTFDLALRDQSGFTSGPLDAPTGTGYYIRVGGNEFAVKALDPQYLQVYTDAGGSVYPVAYAPPWVGPDPVKDPSGVASRTSANEVELTSEQSPLPYAVYFRDYRGDDVLYGHARGFIADMPLWSLVALDASGDPAKDANGDAVAQRPGLASLTSLLDTSAVAIPKSEVYFIEDPKDVNVLQQGPNVALTNIRVPLVHIKKVELLDSLTDEVLDEIPYAQPLRIQCVDEAAAGTSATVRYWFEKPTSVAVFRDRMAVTALKSGVNLLVPRPLVAYSDVKPTGVTTGSWLSSYGFVEANGDVKVVGAITGFRVKITGTPVTLALYDNGTTAVTVAELETNLRRSIRPGDRIAYWRTSGSDDAVVVTIKTVNSNSFTIYWPTTTTPPAMSGWSGTDDHGDFAVLPGWRADDCILDTDSGYYYADFEFEAAAANAGTIAAGSELSWLTEADTSLKDTAITDAIHSPARVEGWSCHPHNSVLSYSTYERPHLRMTWQVNDDVFLFDPRGLATNVGAPKLRITHVAADGLSAVQDFIRHADNRVVAEETLVRHLPPALVGASVTYKGGELATTTKAALESFFKAANPEVGLEVSDAVKIVDDLGATYIKMPMTLNVRWFDRSRVRKLEVVTDARTLNRLLQTYSDSDRLTVVKS